MQLIAAIKKLGATLVVALGLLSNANADTDVPALTARVTDLTSTLAADQRQELEQLLQAFEVQKGSQVAVLLVATTQPETIEQYSLRVAEKWKLGRKGVDDGALLLIAIGDKKMRIEVGYGLEGVLNDAISKRIIAETITPSFKVGNYYAGIRAGLQQMMSVINGEALPAPVRKGRSRGNGEFNSFFVVSLLILGLGFFLRSTMGRFPGALLAGGAGLVAGLLMASLGIAILGAFALFFITLIAEPGSGRGGYYGGGGGFGGGGGGGFSGGGGGFGGGGASGGW